MTCWLSDERIRIKNAKQLKCLQKLCDITKTVFLHSTGVSQGEERQDESERIIKHMTVNFPNLGKDDSIQGQEA
jgi:hypothetical protein